MRVYPWLIFPMESNPLRPRPATVFSIRGLRLCFDKGGR